MNSHQNVFRQPRTLLSLLVIAFAASAGIGQTLQGTEASSAQSRIGADVGIVDFHQRDKYLSPDIFSGGMFTSRVSFFWSGEESRHAIEAVFSTGGMGPDVLHQDVKQYIGFLSYTYLRVLGRWEVNGSPLVFSAGGGLASYVTDTDVREIDPSQNVTTFEQSWYWSHALHVDLLGEYALSTRDDITVHLSTPLVALVTRPHNGHWLNSSNLDVSKNFLNAATNGRLEYLWDAFVLQAEVGFSHRMSDNVELTGTYLFGYVSSNQPDPMLSLGTYANHFLLGIHWVL